MEGEMRSGETAKGGREERHCRRFWSDRTVLNFSCSHWVGRGGG
jgi:hypothetical protein